jgi:uncharacterized protein YcnI
MIRRLRNWIAGSLGIALLLPAMASAHVVVTPKSLSVGEHQTFSVSVPNEKDVAVTQLKIDIPNGVSDVTPSAKTGWTITTDKADSGQETVVKSITWSGGSIPAGQRDDFTFSAQAPEKSTELHWNAYQTYADGTTVAWNQKPTDEESESGTSGPYSVTEVTSDPEGSAANESNDSSGTLALIISVLALITAVAALLRPAKKV